MIRQIHHLNCGTLSPPLGAALVGSPTPGVRHGDLVCHCLLLETDAVLLLVDAGFGLADVAHPVERVGRPFLRVVRPHLDAAETAVRQVEALGYDPSDVRHVVLTHMDHDHTGGLGDFPDAQVHVLAAEHDRATTRPRLLDRHRYRPVHWAHVPASGWQRYDPTGASWFGFQASEPLRGVGEDIRLVSLPGHTAGHAGVAIPDGDGWLLHAGDAYLDRYQVYPEATRQRLLTRAFDRVVQDDLPTAHATRQRLVAWEQGNRPAVRMVCAHDADDLAAARRGWPPAPPPAGPLRR